MEKNYPQPLRPNAWLVYCRPGFEADAGAEMAERAAELGHGGHLQMGDGWVRLVLDEGMPANALHGAVSFDSLVFARQSLVASAPLSLSRDDRLRGIVDQVVALGWSFESLWHETPDTNEGKALVRLAHALEKPLASALRKKGALRRRAGKRRLHLLWTAGDEVQVGMSFPGNRSELPGGIRRLRLPRLAPSRAALKLDEALHELIPQAEHPCRVGEGMVAADLGAAPGGWTWVLLRRGLSVYAVDNGPMHESVMAGGRVEHVRQDAFHWSPPRELDWLVCDIVEKPGRVVPLIVRWFEEGWCRESIFNLKLPMKRRYREVSLRLEQLRGGLAETGVRAEVRCRHLYHDREEVTVHVRRVL